MKTTGDGLLAEFASVVDAVRCAVDVQRGMAGRTPARRDKRIEFRIGINLGDIIVDGGDIFGDGVNVAARLEGLAEPGGISSFRPGCRDDVRGKPALDVPGHRRAELKNIARPVRVYRSVDGRRSTESSPRRVSPFPTSPRSRSCRSRT